VHHPNAVAQGIAWAPEAHPLSIKVDLALIRLEFPEQDSHQCRFAGSILPEDSVEFTSPYCEIDVIVRHNRPKALGDPARFEDDSSSGSLSCCSHGSLVAFSLGGQRHLLAAFYPCRRPPCVHSIDESSASRSWQNVHAIEIKVDLLQ
jgi:hypothetical protein